MTREPNIERVLDRWFTEGSSAMPDRVLYAVLDGVERTPQRRWLALLPRSTTMTPTLRLGLAAAALAVVVVAGFSVLRPTPGPGATPSPSLKPTPSPTAAAAFTPSALLGRWMGSPRTVDGIDPAAGTALLFTLGSVAISQGNHDDQLKLSSAVSFDATSVTLTSANATGGCSSGDKGVLSWQRSTSGQTLTLTSTADTCSIRAAAFAGTWWKMDCLSKNDNCLGPSDAGAYSSQFFDPFQATNWQARYGALSYTVPDGWSVAEDWPAYFRLKRDVDPDDTAIYLFSDVVIKAQSADCATKADPAVGETAADIKTWLTTSDGLSASEPVAVTVGGLSGWEAEVQLNPAWTTACPFSNGLATKGMFVGRDPNGGFDWGINAGGRMDLTILDLGDGRALVIDIEAQSPEAYAALRPPARAVVQTFQFTR